VPLSCTPLFSLYAFSSTKCRDTAGLAQLYPGTQGLPKLRLKSTSHRQKFCLFSFKSLDVYNDCTPRTIKVLKAAKLGRTDKHKDKSKQEAIISGLYRTFIHLGSSLHESKRKNKDDTTTTATPLLSHPESREQATKGRAMPEILRPSMPRSRGHPPDLPLGPRCARTHAAPARALTLGNVIKRQPTPIGYPTDPVGSRSINMVLDQVHRQG
jgi:hypothetical protein